VGLDAALVFPFSMKMETDIAGLVDNATFKIKSRLGFKASLPVTYDFYSVKSMKMFAFGTPYYERWNIGQSPDVILTQGGVPVAQALEPKSSTDMFGIRVGVGVNF
jgi:hypothetical protein